MALAKSDYTPALAAAEMRKLCEMIGPRAQMSCVLLDRDSEDALMQGPLHWVVRPIGFAPGSEEHDFRGRAASFLGAIYAARMAWLEQQRDPEADAQAEEDAREDAAEDLDHEDRAIDTDRLRDERDERRRLAKEYPDNE